MLTTAVCNNIHYTGHIIFDHVENNITYGNKYFVLQAALGREPYSLGHAGNAIAAAASQAIAATQQVLFIGFQKLISCTALGYVIPCDFLPHTFCAGCTYDWW